MTTESNAFPTDFQRDEAGRPLVGHHTLSHVRARISGWHFSQEAMDAQAVEVLHYAEHLLEELDRRHGGFAQ